MKPMIALFLLLSGTVRAQDDMYRPLTPGDRVQITFRTGGTLVGTLIPPPEMGPLGPRTKPKAALGQPSSTPFAVLLFHRKDDPSGQAQAGIVESWLKQHPEATLNLVKMEDRGSADLVKLYNVIATPTIVVKDAVSAQAQVQVGLQSAERLNAALARLRARLEEEKVDYTTEQFLTLDVRLEYPGLNGTMSISKKDIREVRKLQKLDEATRKRLEEEHRKIREAQASDEAARREAEARRTQEALAEIEKSEKEAAEAALKGDEAKALQEKAEKLKEAEELLKQFPPDQWNEEKLKDIANRSQLRLPVTPEERQFVEKQAQWAEAVKMQKEKEKKEKATEEGSEAPK